MKLDLITTMSIPDILYKHAISAPEACVTIDAWTHGNTDGNRSMNLSTKGTDDNLSVR